MKNIFYIVSILIIAAAAYFSWDNSKKIESEISNYEEVRGKKLNVEGSIEKTEGQLDDTEAALEQAKTLNAELTETKQNEVAKQRTMEASIEKFEADIVESDAELAKFAEIKAEIDAQLAGVEVPWDQMEAHITDLQDKRKRLGDDYDNLVTLVAKLTQEVADKRAESARQSTRLTEIRTRIARNEKVGAVTSVNSTWGFVIVNLGTENSNIKPSSTLVVTRNGRRIASLTPTSVEANQTIADLRARDVVPGVRIQPGDTVTIAESAGS